MLNFHLVSLFPEFFESPLAASLIARGRKNGLLRFTFHNPRDFSVDKHRHVDDSPYGGGLGMVMQPGPLAAAIRSIEKPGRILCMSPSGRPFDQDIARSLASERDISIICGRYEGIDARLADIFNYEELSLCQAVLNGGETAALAVIEAVSRFLPGFLGKDDSVAHESFSDGLLEYPQYTRPENFENMRVPEILLNGHHARINSWRREQSLLRTFSFRPDLLNAAPLGAEDAEILRQFPGLRAGRNLCFALFHYPVWLEKGKTGVSSLTNLDIHDIARISRSYGMGPFYVLTPLNDQLKLLRKILWHWTQGAGAAANKDRVDALKLVRPVSSFDELDRHASEFYGIRPKYIATSASWPGDKEMPLTPDDILSLCENGPVVICLGTAKGLAIKEAGFFDGRARPLRFLNANHLSVRSAAAILADRILGDFF